MRSRPTLVLASSLLCLVVLVAPAQAAFPGANGKISFFGSFNGNSGLFTMQPDGTSVTLLTGDPFRQNARWSADGSKLTFTSTLDGADDVFVMNADGSQQTNVTRLGLNPLPNDPNSAQLPAWSPDGLRITFDNQRDIWIINADGTGLTNVTNDPSTADAFAAWSPDGSRIAFASDRGGAGTSNIYTINPDGTDIRRVTNSSAYDQAPNWAPDGSKIAFRRFGLDDFFSYIYTINPDGTDAVNLTAGLAGEAPGAGSVSYSPDGTKIAFAFTGDTHDDIFVMAADGSNVTNLTNTPDGPEFNPDWQPIQASTPGPKRSDYKNAAKFCKAERAYLGDAAFAREYGTNKNGANAHGKCVSGSR